MGSGVKTGLILAFAGLLGVLPFLYNAGLIHWLDWHLHLFWLQEFHQGLAQGNGYPRWLAEANGGYGAPVFVFYAPLSYFLGSLGVAVLGNPLAGMKFVFCLAIFSSCYSAYAFYRNDRRNLIAAFAATALCLSPQWLVFSYRMNMPATTLALVFVPLVFLGLSRLDHPQRRWRILVAVSFSLVIMSHTLSGFLLGLMAGLWCLWFGLLERNRGQMWDGLMSLTLGVGLSSIYLLPAVAELPLVHSENLQAPLWLWFKNFLFLAERSPDAAFNVDAPFLDLINGATALALLLGHFTWWRFGRHDRRVNLLLVSAWLSLVMMLPVSNFLYEVFSPLQKIQFPWRWQPFFSLFAFAAIAAIWSKLKTPPKSLAILQVLVIVPGLYFSAQLSNFFGVDQDNLYQWTSSDSISWALAASRWDTLEHRPVTMGAAWQRDLRGNRDSDAYFIQGSGKLSRLEKQQHRQTWSLDVSQAGKLRLKLLYFPGWQAFVDDQPQPISYSADMGAIIVPVPAGQHRLDLRFENTRWRWLGLWLSCFSLIVLLVYAGLARRRRC